MTLKVGCATNRKIIFWGEGVGKRYNTVRVRSIMRKDKNNNTIPGGGWVGLVIRPTQ